MELYEALKNGTSIEELKTAFDKELKEASARIEQEKENDDKLKKARKALMDAIAAYTPLYTKKPDNEYDVEDLVRALENTIDHSFGPKKNWYRAKKTDPAIDIINEFLRSL